MARTAMKTWDGARRRTAWPKVRRWIGRTRAQMRRARSLCNYRGAVWLLRKAFRPHQTVIVPLDRGLRIRVLPRDVVGEEIVLHGLFEAGEARLIMNLLKPGMVFVDLGANIGQYTLLAARAVGEGGEVHSFEPNARVFNELERNVKLNDLGSRCRLNRMAVSDCEGMGSLALYQEGAEVYGTLGQRVWDGVPEAGRCPVETIRLDSYVAGAGLRRVDLVKMDIEGAELLALRGAEEVIRTWCPAFVVELADVNAAGFGHGAGDVWDHLATRGYRFFDFDQQGALRRVDDRPLSFYHALNVLAVPKVQRPGGVVIS